MINKDTE